MKQNNLKNWEKKHQRFDSLCVTKRITPSLFGCAPRLSRELLLYRQGTNKSSFLINEKLDDENNQTILNCWEVHLFISGKTFFVVGKLYSSYGKPNRKTESLNELHKFISRKLRIFHIS
jgi:hypothetical protein